MNSKSKIDKNAVEVLAGFASLIRKFEMYPTGHPFFKDELGSLIKRFDEYFANQPSLTVGIGADRIFMDDEEVAEGEWALLLSEILHPNSVSQITFHKGIKKEEIKSFLETFRIDPLAAKQAGGYSKLIGSKGITSIEVVEVDYKLHESDMEKQLLALSDAEVWQRIATSYRPGRKTISSKDRGFLMTLLNNKPRLAGLLDMKIVSQATAEEAEKDAQVFFEMIESIKEDGDGKKSPDKTMEEVRRLFDIMSPKTNYALLQKGAIEKKTLKDEKPMVWKVIHRLGEHDLAKILMEGLDPEFARKKNYVKTYLHFISPKNEKGVLEKIRNILRDRDFKDTETVKDMIRKAKVMSKAHPAMDRLGKILEGEYHGVRGWQRPIHKFIEKHYRQEPGFAEDFSLLKIEQAACRNLLTTLDLLKGTGNYSLFAQGIDESITVMIHLGQYSMAQKAIDKLIAHSLDKSLPEPTMQMANDLLDSLRNEDLADELVEALCKWGKAESELLGKLLCALGDVAVPPMLEALRIEKNRGTRAVLIDILSGLGDCACVELKGFLESEDWFVVRNMIALMARLKPDDMLDDLHKTADHDEPRVRKETAKALSAAEAEGAIALLKYLAEDPDQSVRQQALLSIGRFKDSGAAARALMKILSKSKPFGGDIKTERMALGVLAKMKHKDVLPFIGGYFTGSGVWKLRDESVIQAAISAAATIPDKGAQSLLKKGSKSLSGAISKACKKALKEHGSAGAS